MPRKRDTAPGATEIGDRVWWARRVLGDVSQERLAEMGGCSRLAVQGLEAGRSKGNSAKLRSALAKAFGVSEDRMSAYLDGELGSPSEESARRFLQPPSEPRHYTNRERAVVFMLADGQGDRATIQEAADRAARVLEAGEDPSALWWVEAMKPFVKVPGRGR